MPQFDVFENRAPDSKARIPFLLDVQSDLLSSLNTRVVVPLARPEVLGQRAAARLNPRLTVLGVELVLLTPELAGVSKTTLGRWVANLAEARTEIIDALDIVFTGV